MRLPVNDVNVRQKFSKLHKGVDFGFVSSSLGKNQPIYAADDGEVIYNRKQTSGGYVIHIRHDNGYVTEYGHLKKNSQKVREGQRVKKGQQIASMGNTGIVTGYHLHFGMYKGNKINYKDKSNFVDPLDYLCKFDNQIVYKNSKVKNFYETKIVTGVEEEPLNVRNKSRQIVKSKALYNGDEIETYTDYSASQVYVDNIRKYTTYKKYLK